MKQQTTLTSASDVMLLVSYDSTCDNVVEVMLIDDGVEQEVIVKKVELMRMLCAGQIAIDMAASNFIGEISGKTGEINIEMAIDQKGWHITARKSSSEKWVNFSAASLKPFISAVLSTFKSYKLPY